MKVFNHSPDQKKMFWERLPVTFPKQGRLGNGPRSQDGGEGTDFSPDIGAEAVMWLLFTSLISLWTEALLLKVKDI